MEPSRSKRTAVQLSIVLIVTLFGTGSAKALSCERLKALDDIPYTTIMQAQTVTGPQDLSDLSTADDHSSLPAFCRVTARIRPTRDSDIKVEIWLPATDWNRKFRGTGNGGFAGSINYADMLDALRAGYATAGTDTGHAGTPTDASWASRHPNKTIDFGYRGIHMMTVAAKAIVAAFYGSGPQYSYFAGCSDGGREALMEAQRFPGDYNGIIAGAPAADWTRIFVGAVWGMQATLQTPASYIPPNKIDLISRAVLAACDALDGVVDGVLNDPRACRFEPTQLLCKGADADDCLTSDQVVAVSKLYAGPRDSTGHQISPGYLPGGEQGPGGWTGWVTGSAPQRSVLYAFASGFFSNMVFENSSWDFRNFNFDKDVSLTERKLSSILNAVNPNLTRFQSHGGKLIMYHGWSDPAIPAVNSIDYYNRVVAAVGAQQANSLLRLYMVPGMQHCEGGPGPSSFGQLGIRTAPQDAQHNIYLALEAWTEDGKLPAEIITTQNISSPQPGADTLMGRPLCPYPQVAKYKGSGDTNLASNFACVRTTQ